MSININPELKPLYANLLRLGIARYLITQRFDHLCIENNLDQLWESCESHIRSLSNVAILIPGYTGYATDALGIFLEQLLKLGNEQFLDLVGKIITDFIEWNDEEIDLSKVKEALLNLGYDSYKIENTIQNKENSSIENVPSKEIEDYSNRNNKISEKNPIKENNQSLREDSIKGSNSFFIRNKDELIVGLIVGIVIAFFTAILGLFMGFFSFK